MIGLYVRGGHLGPLCSMDDDDGDARKAHKNIDIAFSTRWTLAECGDHIIAHLVTHGIAYDEDGAAFIHDRMTREFHGHTLIQTIRRVNAAIVLYGIVDKRTAEITMMDATRIWKRGKPPRPTQDHVLFVSYDRTRGVLQYTRD